MVLVVNITPVMYTDITGQSWSSFWNSTGGRILGTVLVVAAVIALSILTAGVSVGITAALGSGFWSAVVGGAISGAIFGAGFSILSQGISNGYSNINYRDVGKAILIGAASGAVMGAAFVSVGRGLGLLGKTKWAQRQLTNWGDDTVNYMFGSKSGSFTFARYGKVARIEASIQHGLHLHYSYIITAPLWKGVFIVQNQVAGFLGGIIDNVF